jgi:hypothetical protein
VALFIVGKEEAQNKSIQCPMAQYNTGDHC